MKNNYKHDNYITALISTDAKKCGCKRCIKILEVLEQKLVAPSK